MSFNYNPIRGLVVGLFPRLVDFHFVITTIKRLPFFHISPTHSHSGRLLYSFDIMLKLNFYPASQFCLTKKGLATLTNLSVLNF